MVQIKLRNGEIIEANSFEPTIEIENLEGVDIEVGYFITDKGKYLESDVVSITPIIRTNNG